MLRKLRRLSWFILRLALVSLAVSVLVFLVSTPSQLLPKEKGDMHVSAIIMATMISIIDPLHYVWVFPISTHDTTSSLLCTNDDVCSGLLLILVTAVSERDPFPWEADVEGESDDAEFRGHYSHDTHTQ